MLVGVHSVLLLLNDQAARFVVTYTDGPNGRDGFHPSGREYPSIRRCWLSISG